MNDLEKWLEANGLGGLAALLAASDVDLEILASLTESDLTEIGLSVGNRRRLLRALETDPPRSSAGEPPAQTAAARDETQPESAERRQLTVMFCDLVGSTSLSETLDPEDMRRLLGLYHDCVSAAVTNEGGHVAKFLGDGVLAYFGWPQAMEDAAERALRAGLAAVEKVAQLETTAPGLAASGLSARVGVATGPVVIGDMEGSAARERGAVVGATPNLAARLQDLAKPGTVVTHGATRALVGAAFHLQDQGSHALKGFKDPVQVWSVTGRAETSSRFEAQHGSGLTQFVGRSQELALLEERLRQARGGEGQAVLLSGEAGIGKSRILREFLERRGASGGGLVQLQCASHETNTAFHPFIAELSAACGLRGEDSPELRRAKLKQGLAAFLKAAPAALAYFAALLSLPGEEEDLASVSPQRRKQMTQGFLLQRLKSLAGAGELVVVAEDLHWADPSSLETLEALTGSLADLPILLVATARPEFTPAWGGGRSVTSLSLSRLGRGAGSEVANAAAGGKELPEALMKRIIEQTDGIPLFIEELTKSILETGLLREEEGRFSLDGPLPDMAIPATLQDSLMARLDRLAPVKVVVQAAACIGREFDAGLLSDALGLKQGDLEKALEQLVEAQLVFPVAAGEDARFTFKHALVQDAAYSSLLKEARQALHAKIARALDQRDEADDLDRARHFRAAGAQERAAELYLSGGARSLAASALPEAIGALELGLDCSQGLAAGSARDRLELDLRVALGAARMANFGWAHDSVSQALEPAFPLAMEAQDGASLGPILWGLWVHYQTKAQFDKAHFWLSKLEEAAAAGFGSDLPLVYDMSAGCQCFWEAGFAEALSHTDRLKGLYRQERHSAIAAFANHDPLVFSQHWAGSFAAWISGRPEEALERMEEALDLARRIGHPFNRVFALTAGASCLIYLGETQRLLALCDEAAEVVEQEALGPFADYVLVKQWRGGAYCEAGDFEKGHALASEGNAFWTASGGRICTAMFRSWIAEGLKGLGKIEEALALNAGNIAHCRETGDRYMEPEVLRLQGELHLLLPKPNQMKAEAYFLEAAEESKRRGARSWELRALASQAKLLRRQGRDREARSLLEPALAGFAQGQATRDFKEAETLIQGRG
jgi:class 3 adenylate cyclase/predicted ATPase